MRLLVMSILLSATAIPVSAQTADTIVMRKVMGAIAYPKDLKPKYGWAYGEWTSPTNACGTTVQTRTVTCVKGGRPESPDLCRQAPQAATRTVEDLSSCVYDWKTTYSGWQGSCTAAATRSATSVCRRSDGTVVADALCDYTSRPKTVETAANYAGCVYDWKVGTWSQWSSTCSNSSLHTRSVTCEAMTDEGTGIRGTVDKCRTPQPVDRETQKIVTDCTGMLVNGNFESDMTGWTPTSRASISSTVAHGGKKSMQIYNTSSISQTIQTVIGASYSVTFYSYQYGSNGIRLMIGGNLIAGGRGSNGNYEWFQRSGSFVATSDTTKLTFLAEGGFTFTSEYVDDIVVAQSPM